MPLKQQVIHGQALRVNENGVNRVHIYIATELPHGSGTDPLAVGYQWLQDIDVDYDSDHPFIDGLSVIDIYGETYNNSPAQAKYTVTYGPQASIGPLSGEKIVTIRSSTYRRVVRYDASGELIKPTYNGRSVVGEVETTQSNDILEFEYEDGDPPPVGLRNAVNSDDYEGGAPGTWLCRERVARKIIARTLWRIKLSFEYDEEGWNKASIYRDPITGVIPTDVDAVTPGTDSGNGWVRPPTHPEFAFGSLGLPEVYPSGL